TDEDRDMTGMIGFILALWLLAEVNFLRRSEEKTTDDFKRTPEEERRWGDCQRGYQKAEALYRRVKRDRQNLEPLIARTRRLKDGTFDRRYKAGKMLNRELPRLEQARREALAEKKTQGERVLGLEKLPDIRRDRWVRAESFRGACRHGVVLLPVLVALDAGGVGGANRPHGLLLLLLWSGLAGALALKYVYSTRKALRV
ncbi:MAG: hypothetical protein VX574_11275, partial [Myxococcota bacterium]|nr:hypothetical protein [Myxococcota bacterium]